MRLGTLYIGSESIRRTLAFSIFCVLPGQNGELFFAISPIVQTTNAYIFGESMQNGSCLKFGVAPEIHELITNFRKN